MRFTQLALVSCLALTVGCAPATQDGSAAAGLYDIVDREWQVRLEANPLTATSVGVHDYDDRLPSVDPEDLEHRDGVWRGFLDELDELDRGGLSEADRINFDIFRAQLDNRVESYRFGAYQVPFNADSGFYSGFARLGFDMPFRTTENYETKQLGDFLGMI